MTVVLTQGDFEDLADLAGYSIGYWADSAHLEPDQYTIVEEDSGAMHMIPRVRMEQVMTQVAAGGYEVTEGLREAVRSGDLGELDGGDVDALFQLCAFGEVVYG